MTWHWMTWTASTVPWGLGKCHGDSLPPSIVTTKPRRPARGPATTVFIVWRCQRRVVGPPYKMRENNVRVLNVHPTCHKRRKQEDGWWHYRTQPQPPTEHRVSRHSFPIASLTLPSRPFCLCVCLHRRRLSSSHRCSLTALGLCGSYMTLCDNSTTHKPLW